VLGRDRIMSARQFEADSAIFYDDGVARVSEIPLQGAGESGSFHTIIVTLPNAGFATETRKHGEKKTKMGIRSGVF